MVGEKIQANVEYVIGVVVASFNSDIDDIDTIKLIIEQCDAYGKLYERDSNSPFLSAYLTRLENLGLNSLRVEIEMNSEILLEKNTKYVFTNSDKTFAVVFSNDSITQSKLRELITAVVSLYDSELSNLIIYLTSLGCIYFEYANKIIINMLDEEDL